MEEFKEALGADVVLPVTPLTVYNLRQHIVRAEALLKEARDLLWHAYQSGNLQDHVRSCPGCKLEDRIDDFLSGQDHPGPTETQRQNAPKITLDPQYILPIESEPEGD